MTSVPPATNCARRRRPGWSRTGPATARRRSMRGRFPSASSIRNLRAISARPVGSGWDGRRSSAARRVRPLEQIAFIETMERGEAPRIGAAIQANALMMFGTPEQQQKYLPEILRGEAMHGMGYSEPQAGSDLAAMRTSAVRDGDSWVINGQKIWTTTWWGKYMFLAARTDPQAKPPHAGISMFIVPMDAPGITIRPATTMYDGSFANIFYDDVRIPLENLVGEVNGGWKVLTGALAFERGLVGGGIVLKVTHAFEQLRKHVMAREGDALPLCDDAIVRDKMATLACEIEVGRQLMMHCAELAVGRDHAAGIRRDQQGVLGRADGALRREPRSTFWGCGRALRADAGRARQWPVRAKPAAFPDVGHQHRDQRNSAQPDRATRAWAAQIGDVEQSDAGVGDQDSAARGRARARFLDHAGRPLLRAAARRCRRRCHQDRAAGRRRHAAAHPAARRPQRLFRSAQRRESAASRST